MNIFRLFESNKNIKLCSKTHQMAPFKKSMPPNPPSKCLATPRVASTQKVGPLGKSCIRPWTIRKNLFEEMCS